MHRALPRPPQAIAKQSGATFINVRMGAVQQKYVGEGEKMVAAIFRCANTTSWPVYVWIFRPCGRMREVSYRSLFFRFERGGVAFKNVESNVYWLWYATGSVTGWLGIRWCDSAEQDIPG